MGREERPFLPRTTRQSCRAGDQRDDGQHGTRDLAPRPRDRSRHAPAHADQDAEKNARISRRVLPVDPTDESLWAKGAEAAGSAVPFAFSSAVGGLAGLPEFIIPSLLGAASNAGSTYEEAVAAGVTPEQAK